MPRAVRQGQGAGDNARLVQRRHMGPNIFLYTRLRLSPNAAVLISVVTSSVVIVVVAAAAVVHKASFDPTSTPPFPNQQFLAHDSSVHPPPCLRHPSISNPHCTRSGCAQSAPAVTPAADLVDAMANTFADYPAHTMANNDFTLYPYQDQTWDNDSFLPNSNFSDPNFVNPTTLDSFPANAAYANEHFTFQSQTYRQQSPSHPKHAVQATSSTYSPTLSASHSFDAQNPPLLSSTSDSGASVQSTISSAMGSPSGFAQTSTGVEWSLPDMRLLPGIVQQDCMNTAAPELFATSAFDLETVPVTDKGCVDPSLIQSFSPTQYAGAQFPEVQAMESPQPMQYRTAAPSPAASHKTCTQSPRTSNGKAPSPYMRPQSWQPYPSYPGSRRQSNSSVHSRHSQASLSSDDSNKGPCPLPTCGRYFKDLKSHILTHQNERPEKCPIPTCEYHTKGFARKYDKNRHTLTHYKGTMVCGFCPGSGSAAEKSFNRADVFKRHLTSVHGVEQTPPNARRKSPGSAAGGHAFGTHDGSGMCSTCGNTFASAQDIYEHLDECVLRVVQQADPGEAINEKLLTSVADDAVVRETLERHMLPDTATATASGSSFDEAEEDEDVPDGDDDEGDDTYEVRSGPRSGKGGIVRRSHKPPTTSSTSS